MNKVIFLDIDGVLNTNWWYTQMDRNTPKDKYGYAFDPKAVANLKRIVEETGANIVISSSWKCLGLTQMEEVWNDRNLPGKIIGITPNTVSDEMLLYADIDSMEMFHIRGEEIREWLSYWEVQVPAPFLSYLMTQLVRRLSLAKEQHIKKIG